MIDPIVRDVSIGKSARASIPRPTGRAHRGANFGMASHRPSPATRTRAVVCVGIDLAGVEHRETGVAVLRDGRLERLGAASTDLEIIDAVRGAGRRAIVAINAPLTRPIGRCCLEDDCRCRTDPGTRSRLLERELGRMGIPTLATALLKVLARRGQRLAMALRVDGYDPLEVYPYATMRLMGVPTAKKKTREGRRRIHDALKRRIPGLRHPDASDHQLDAVVCAWTAHLWAIGKARSLGAPDEGLVTIPSRRLRKSPAPGLGA